MTKPISKPNNPTQLDAAADKTTKKSKSAKSMNQPKSANPANTSDFVNSENMIDTAKAMNMVSEATLFADELVPSVKPEDTSEHNGISSTDSKSESVELNSINSPDEKKSHDGDVALDLAPPAQSKESDSMNEMESNVEITAIDKSTESVELNERGKFDEPNSAETLNPSNEPKPTRVSAKMRRQELDDYVEKFLQPGQIAKRHTVVIEEETWKRISYNVRKIGLEDSTGSAYVEAIIRDHLNRYEDKVEEWRKL